MSRELNEWESQFELTHDWQKGEVTQARLHPGTRDLVVVTGWFHLTSDERAVVWKPTWKASGRILCDIEVLVAFTS